MREHREELRLLATFPGVEALNLGLVYRVTPVRPERLGGVSRAYNSSRGVLSPLPFDVSSPGYTGPEPEMGLGKSRGTADVDERIVEEVNLMS